MSNNSDKFEKFLLSEYQNIAQAHFKSIETITTFFRYYLLIMSIPLSAIAIIVQSSSSSEQLRILTTLYRIEIFLVLFFISFIGFGVFWYIINLRFDAVLYARVVNGVRKYFYDQFNKDINLKIRVRVLPQSPQLPTYVEWPFFLPVLVVFSLMNSIYFFLGSRSIGASLKCASLMTMLFLLCHFGLYKLVAWLRETSYLKSNILGIDIDGVLNKHREQFSRVIKSKVGKEIDPEQILITPVHEYLPLNITREDERKVFNDPKYWIDMPIRENVSKIIRTLRNIFKLKIIIFTHRPWPDMEDKYKLIEITKQFCQNTKAFSLRLMLLKIGIKLHLNWLVEKYKEEPLRLITIRWLRDNKILFHKFILEKGNDHSSDPRGRIKNRFYESQKNKIRFFVEDDYEKAIKLSYICDVVFLLSHPYNEPNILLSDDINNLRQNLPSNILCVKNWDEIYQHIRRLS